MLSGARTVALQGLFDHESLLAGHQEIPQHCLHSPPPAIALWEGKYVLKGELIS